MYLVVGNQSFFLSSSPLSQCLSVSVQKRGWPCVWVFVYDLERSQFFSHAHLFTVLFTQPAKQSTIHQQHLLLQIFINTTSNRISGEQVENIPSPTNGYMPTTSKVLSSHPHPLSFFPIIPSVAHHIVFSLCYATISLIKPNGHIIHTHSLPSPALSHPL